MRSLKAFRCECSLEHTEWIFKAECAQAFLAICRNWKEEKVAIRWRFFCRSPLNHCALELEGRSTLLKEDHQVWKISQLCEFIIVTDLRTYPFSLRGQYTEIHGHDLKVGKGSVNWNKGSGHWNKDYSYWKVTGWWTEVVLQWFCSATQLPDAKTNVYGMMPTLPIAEI